MSSPDFIASRLAGHDAVLLSVLAAPRPQALRARIERLYAGGHGIDPSCVGAELEFVRAPGHWGDTPLQPGQRAIVFLTLIAGRLYEGPWRGHLLVEEVDGVDHAVYPHRELWLSADCPPLLAAAARQDPRRAQASAIRLDAVEQHLAALARQAERAGA